MRIVRDSTTGGILSRFVGRTTARLVVVACALAASRAVAVDGVTFNITAVSLDQGNPFPPIPNIPSGTGSSFSYADVWAENGYIYLGSDRGRLSSPNQNLPRGRGMAIFSISNSGIPTYLPRTAGDPPTTGFVDTTYVGNEMEDVEVYDGIGYFASDTNLSTGRTGVDIVDLAIPFQPERIGRVDASISLAGNPGVVAHEKVHTISIQRFNPGTPSEQRFLYTSDNETSVVKITDVSSCMGDPLVPCNPQLVKSLPLTGVGSSVDAHEVVVRNNKLYVAAKNPSNTSGEGYVQIFDVSNPAAPIPLMTNAFLSGAESHTAMPTDDGKTLVVAEERQNGNVKIYDISNPGTPVLKATLNTSNVCHNGSCISAHSPHHVHIHGKLMFIPWYDAGLQVFNITNPAAPVYVGAFDTLIGTPPANFSGNWGVDLSLGLKRVLLSDRQRGLLVVDASGVIIPGDYNQDMVVNNLDYDVWRAAFGTTRSSVHDAPYADGNYDGVVDGADYVVWRDHFGQVQTGMAVGSSLVPEPASTLLLVVGASLMMPRRRVRVA